MFDAATKLMSHCKVLMAGRITNKLIDIITSKVYYEK